MEAFISVSIIFFVIFINWLQVGIIIIRSMVKIIVGFSWALLILLALGMTFDLDITIKVVIAIFKAIRYLLELIFAAA